jgi:preprotein translocase subunit SecE
MPGVTADRSAAKSRGARFKFLSEIISELKKVVWLSRNEVIYLTTLVLIVAVATGLFLGLVDYGFTTLVDKFIH